MTARIKLPSRSPGWRVGPKDRSEFPVCLSAWCGRGGYTCRLRGCSSAACLRQPGKAQVRAGLENVPGEELMMRTGTLQSFFVIRWDFSIDRLPEFLVSESLLLHDSAERVILAGCHWWKKCTACP